MSIKRYDVGMTEETNSRTGFYASYPRVYEAEQGRYVEYSDYARLRAEVERLDTLCKQLMAQHSDISCENIMLRKAGDALAEAVGDPTIDWPPRKAAWNAAKEGKPSV